MSGVGGSVLAITLAGRLFSVAADAEVQRDIGGFTNESKENGDGTGRLIKTRKKASLKGISVDVDDSRGDHEFLQDLADRNDYFDVAMTYAYGAIYQGTMQIGGDIMHSNTNQVVNFDLEGTGKLTRQ